MRLGSAIKLVRTQRGLKQLELAQRASLSVSHISLLERDTRDPTYSTLIDIACALDIPLTALVFLAAESGELEGISSELAEKLSHLILKLLQSEDEDA